MTIWRYGPPQFPEFTVMSTICAVIILLPVTSHWKARNVATLSMIAWLFTVNTLRIVNSIVWANNVDFRLTVWCDITTKITVGCTVAIPACALCICRYLEAVASIRWARQTEQQKRNRMWFELGMCFGLPILFMALHYVVQGHRFDIIEHIGCQATAVKTWVTVVLMYVPPLLLALIAMGYAASAVRHFYRRRVDFKRHLSASNSGISASRYLRLMLLAITEIVVDTSFNVYIIWVNTTEYGGLIPWTGWADVHSNFSRIQPLPYILFPPAYWTLLRFSWWIVPIGTIIFWFFFAFGQEAIAEYKCWWNWFQRKVLRRDIKPTGSQSLPSSSTRVGQKKSKKGFFSFFSSGATATATASASVSGTSAAKPKIYIPRLPFIGNRSSPTSSDASSPSVAKKGRDDDSFVSGDNESTFKHPLSPISPVNVSNTPTFSSAHRPLTYMEPELDTTVFDQISSLGNISIGEAEDPDHIDMVQVPPPQTQEHGSLATLGPYHPYYHPGSNRSATFASTAVRSDTPNLHTNGVQVTSEVEVEVV